MSSDSEIERLYREVVLAHYREPRHREPLAAPDGRGRAVNPTCGDAVDVEIALRDGRVGEVSARALGCSIAVASGSVLAEVIRGRDPADAPRLTAELADIVQGRGAAGADPRLRAFAPLARLPARQRCALLAWEALAAALAEANRPPR
jgi:SUF system NifU family Fe-S assembly protein